MKTMAKLNEIDLNLLLYPPYSPDLDPSNYKLFADFKEMPPGKRFDTNERFVYKSDI